uniref:BTB domain-containing protein n=1 Tax=Chelonoidis abingdonii TaxID=106734 RepID=A0A8C0IR42_CHEAB
MIFSLDTGNDIYSIIKYNDDDHKTVFLKTLNEQRLEGEFCDIAIVVEDVKFRAHRCVLAACSTYFKKLFKKLEVDSSSVIEIDFLRSDIFEEVLNYMYTAKISKSPTGKDDLGQRFQLSLPQNL